MSAQPLTLNVPEALYSELKNRARQYNRSVETEALLALATALPVGDEVPSYIVSALAPLIAMTDAELQGAARTRLAPNVAEALEALNEKQRRAGLTPQESQLQALMLREYEQVMLIRAQAVALLHERGHDVDQLLQ